MKLLLLGAVALLVPGTIAFLGARREYLSRGRVSGGTFVALLLAYAGYTAATLTACWTSAGPLDIPRPLALGAGLPLMALGILVFALARLQFRSFRETWGLATERLVTGGIYRDSRNPQIVGIIAFFLGAAIASRSGVALGLVAIYTVASHVWIRVEERFLERIFGADYRAYRDTVRRYVGRSRGRRRDRGTGSDDAAAHGARRPPDA